MAGRDFTGPRSSVEYMRKGEREREGGREGGRETERQ